MRFMFVLQMPERSVRERHLGLRWQQGLRRRHRRAHLLRQGKYPLLITSVYHCSLPNLTSQLAFKPEIFIAYKVF